MIGFYDYTVVVTYISLVSSIVGMFCAIDGKLTIAVFCLAFSGLCDMFDGKIARTKKDRTDDEKSFGIQIDSLCDIVCFGIFADHSWIQAGHVQVLQRYHTCVLWSGWCDPSGIF